MQMNRLFEMVYILLSQENVTAKELANRFGVSQRTIYRDMDTLSLAGIPIYTNKGRGGGIRLLPGFVMDKFLLNEREQNEILSALQGLSTVKTEETDQVLKKLRIIFNRSTVNWIKVDFSDWSFQNGDTFYLLKDAILTKHIVEFDYYSTYGERIHRKAEPVQLWFKSKAWYLKSFCLSRNDIRLFKLTRMKNLIVTDKIFPEHDLLKTCVISSPEDTCPRRDITLMLKIAPEMSYRVYDEFDEDQVEKNADGSYTVSVTWPEDGWVYGFILSFGEYMEVLEPMHIKEIIKEKLQRTLNKYS